MADIPPDITISAAQAGFVAPEVAKEREARRAGQAHAANRQVKSLDEASATVDTADGDMAVFTDSEGTGSQGRTSEEESEQETAEENTANDPSGITRDDQGRLHLDVEA